MEAVQRAWKTLCLDDIAEGDITLAVDTSGSMYVYLDFVRREVVKWLRRQNQQSPARRFNLVQYASLATRWQPKSVNCSDDNVTAAEKWLAKQHCSTNSNVLDGLSCAFADLFVGAVCVLSDGSTDYPSSVILDSVLRSNRGRPVHVFLFQHEGESCHLSHSCAVYEQLALRTGGFLKLVHVQRPSIATPRGGADFPRMEPLVRVDTYVKSARQREEQASCSTVLGVRPVVDKRVKILHPKAAWDLIRGFRVLARRTRDGVYYAGQIHDQLDNTTVHIRFDHSFHGSFDSFQATPISDIVSLVDARRQPVCIGDYTLTLYGDKGAYYPGQVTDETYSVQERKSLTVTLFDGTKAFHICGDRAVKISQDKYERLSKELRLREGDLIRTTATESIKEEQKLQEDTNHQEIYTKKPASGSKDASRSSSGSSSRATETVSIIESNQDLEGGTSGCKNSPYTWSNRKGLSTDDASVTYKPGTVLSLGLSYADGYRAGYQDGNMAARPHPRNISLTGSPKPRWRWWSRSPGQFSGIHQPYDKKEPSRDNPDIDTVIQSRRHRCTVGRVDPSLARSQSLTSVQKCNRPNRSMAGDVIYQRPHTADTASLRETKRIEYRREKIQAIQESIKTSREQQQFSEAASYEKTRSGQVQQREKEAGRVEARQGCEETRLAHKQDVRRQQRDREMTRYQDELKERQSKEKSNRDRREARVAWENSFEGTASSKEEQRMTAMKLRADDRYREAFRRWEETKRSKDERLKHLQSCHAKQEDKLDQRSRKEEVDLGMERYAATHNKLIHRATLVP